MQLYRELDINFGEPISSRLKWYEGIIFVEPNKLIVLVAIIPLNVLLRWIRNVWIYIKVGN